MELKVYVSTSTQVFEVHGIKTQKYISVCEMPASCTRQRMCTLGYEKARLLNFDKHSFFKIYINF